ncbi:MAG: S-ribosylhomocysteine lyase [Oscillospiraceae bacterium]|nr:S-ribosylhomocysteine lyase [Oscillospiraceae bacterium]
MTGDLSIRNKIYKLIKNQKNNNKQAPSRNSACFFIFIDYEGEIPGAKPEQCGNYSEQNLNMAKFYIRRYRDSLMNDRRFVYPE